MIVLIARSDQDELKSNCLQSMKERFAVSSFARTMQAMHKRTNKKVIWSRSGRSAILFVGDWMRPF